MIQLTRGFVSIYDTAKFPRRQAANSARPGTNEGDGAISLAGPPVDADAAPASDNDNPAAHNTATLLRRFRFEARLARAFFGRVTLE